MKVWIIKAIVQKFISFLPFKHQVNFLFQKYITKGVHLSDEYFEDKLIHAQNHIRYFRKHISLNEFKALELGSGWYPVIPIYLFLHGASIIISIDIAQHITKENLETTIKKLIDYNDKKEFDKYYQEIDLARFELLKTILRNYNELKLEEILSKLNIKFLIQDARNTIFDDDYFDLITSNNTFEHIYQEILVDILKEFKRILSPNGIMSHFIDMSDHFAHLDKSISIYNFLQYSEKKWNLIDNTIQPQNRLRINQYKEILYKTPLHILEENNRKGDEEIVKKLKLALPFSNFTSINVAVSHSHMVLKK
jgi:SAM-dependent methyltransferase